MLPEIRDVEKWFALAAHEPRDGRYVAWPYVTVTVRRHPEADPTRLPQFAAMIVRCVDALERQLGGEGVAFDAGGTVEEPTRLTLRMGLLSGSDSGHGFERAHRIETMLAELVSRSRTALVAAQDADIRSKISAELEDPFPAEVVEMIEMPVVHPTP